MGNLSNELLATHKSLINASTSMINNVAALSNAANSFVSLVEKVEARIKELEEKEGELKKKEDGIIKKNKELDSRQAKMDEREKVLNDRERSIVGRENTMKEIEKKMEENSANVQSIVQLSVGGQLFVVPKSILLKFKGSYFEAMLTTNYPQQFNNKYFIDHSPKYFQEILDYMRSTQLDQSFSDHQRELKELFEFFKLPVPAILSYPIQQWLPRRKFSLLYKGTRDGFGYETFHKMCDNKGPTITIIQSDKEYLFGGYTPVSWEPAITTRDTIHPEHFLFTLSNPHNIPPTQYKLNNPNDPNAIRYAKGKHITFGYGADLRVADIDSNITYKSYTALGTSYVDTTEKGINTFTGSFYFKLKEVEVHLVI